MWGQNQVARKTQLGTNFKACMGAMHMKFKKGMSLTEVVMAMALITLCIGGIITVVVQSADMGHTADYTYVAIDLAKNRIERIRQIRNEKGYDIIPQTAETDTIIDRNGIPDLNGDFKRTTTIEPTSTRLTKVTVGVTYKRRGLFNPVPVELVTLLSEHH